MTSHGGFVAYYRVSSTKQGISGLGIEAQRAAVDRYLNGGDWRIVAEFTEVESGRRQDRPELDRALAAARLHRCPLVVANVSRLTRSVAFLSRLLEAGVDVRFADMPTIEGPQGRFMLQQMASVAELEAGMISDRTKRALAASKKKLGGVRLNEAGEQVNMITAKAQRAGRDARVAKADDRARDLQAVFVKYASEGVTTFSEAARRLTATKIPAPRGGPWTAKQVVRAMGRIEKLTDNARRAYAVN